MQSFHFGQFAFPRLFPFLLTIRFLKSIYREGVLQLGNGTGLDELGRGIGSGNWELGTGNRVAGLEKGICGLGKDLGATFPM